MNYSFEYIDIILLAMIAGFIFLRLRGILGKRTGFEGKSPAQFKEVLKNIKVDQPHKPKEKFDDEAQKEFLKGARIAYETIITDFSDNDNKITNAKPLLNKEIYNQFDLYEQKGDVSLAKDSSGNGYIKTSNSSSYIALIGTDGKARGDSTWSGWSLVGAETINGTNKTIWKSIENEKMHKLVRIETLTKNLKIQNR